MSLKLFSGRSLQSTQPNEWQSLAGSAARSCEKLVVILSITVFGLLGIASLFITVVMADYTETATYADLTFPAVIMVIAVVACCYALLCRIVSFDRLNTTTVGLFVALILFLGSITWAILCNTFPTFDQLDLIHAAKELGTGRVGNWAPGWYMERYPYQAPYVILIRIMWRVFGDDMLYLSLELVNAVCAAAAGFLLVKLTDKLFSSRATLGTAMMTVLFLPIYFYSTFAYGNVPSLPFAVGAMLSLHCGLESKKWRYFLLSSVCITVSIMLKSTMQVVLIAMVLITLLHAAKTKNLKIAAVVPMIGVVYVLITSSFNIAVSARYDVVLDNGLPKIAWVAMGLIDSAEYPDVSNNPGYYNGFVWNWQLEDYDTEVALSDSWNSIRSSLSRFLSDPLYALRFFGKKIAVVWLEPTYTSLTNGNWSAVVWLEPTYTSLDNGNWLVSTDVGQSPLSDRPMTDILNSVYYGSLNSIILTVCDAVQSILLLSPVVILLRRRGELSPSQLLPVLAVLGFFLIYLVWEAKSQYSLPAYVLLLAYAGPALDIVVCYLGRVASRLRERFNNRRRSAQCYI